MCRVSATLAEKFLADVSEIIAGWVQNECLYAETDCSEWPEFQLLEFLRRTKNSEKSAAQLSQQSGVMTPSGEYVVLEVRHEPFGHKFVVKTPILLHRPRSC